MSDLIRQILLLFPRIWNYPCSIISYLLGLLASLSNNCLTFSGPLNKQKAYLAQGGRQLCLSQACMSIFGLMWPWPLTSWPSKLIVSCPCIMDHLCQLAS